jgi:hypothetical protein
MMNNLGSDQFCEFHLLRETFSEQNCFIGQKHNVKLHITKGVLIALLAKVTDSDICTSSLR